MYGYPHLKDGALRPRKLKQPALRSQNGPDWLQVCLSDPTGPLDKKHRCDQ